MSGRPAVGPAPNQGPIFTWFNALHAGVPLSLRQGGHHAALVLGLVAFAGALALLLRSRFGPTGSGWEDLAAFAGALLLFMAAGALHGVALLLARNTLSPPPLERVTVFLTGGAGSFASGALVAFSLESRSTGLLVSAAIAFALSLAAIVLAARPLPRPGVATPPG